jgi:cysteine desulfurase/selenocysteine lyase
VTFDVAAIRREFPLLASSKALAYLDSAATSQKPVSVLDAMDRYERTINSNVHRAMYPLAEEATNAYEGARMTVQKFIGATHVDEIVVTKNSTEALNLVAHGWGVRHMKEKDAVLLTLLEHHSNIVPWLQLKERRGIDVRWVGIDAEGHIDMKTVKKELAKGDVKMVSVTGLSNVLGARPDIAAVTKEAHAHDAAVCIDAAQLAAHHPIDVTEIDCDFLAFSGHKLYGPTGIGILYGKRECLREMDPMMGGGMMIQEVRTDGFTPADPPSRFEAGTPPITEAIGLAAALDWMKKVGWKALIAHEEKLLAHAQESLENIGGLTILGPKKSGDRSGCLSFVLDGVHAHDLTHALGEKGLCLRAGHQCAQPLHRHLGIPASTRLSVAAYNTMEEIDRLAPAIRAVQSKLQK